MIDTREPFETTEKVHVVCNLRIVRHAGVDLLAYAAFNAPIISYLSAFWDFFQWYQNASMCPSSAVTISLEVFLAVRW